MDLSLGCSTMRSRTDLRMRECDGHLGVVCKMRSRTDLRMRECDGHLSVVCKRNKDIKTCILTKAQTGRCVDIARTCACMSVTGIWLLCLKVRKQQKQHYAH
jgi:hypothetical protein